MPDSINRIVPSVAGPRVDRTVDELPPFQDMTEAINSDAPRVSGPLVAGPRVDRTVDELSPSQDMTDSINPMVPVLAGLVFPDLVSIGKSMNCHPRRAHPRADGPRVDREVGELRLNS